nr:hypothetical protein [uncultured Methanolobus sp.]
MSKKSRKSRQNVSLESAILKHSRRSPRSKDLDHALTAMNTFTPDDQEGLNKWYAQPNRYDIIGIDDNPGKQFYSPKKTRRSQKQRVPPTTPRSALAKKNKKSGEWDVISPNPKLPKELNRSAGNFSSHELDILQNRVTYGIETRRGAAGFHIYDEKTNTSQIRISGSYLRDKNEANDVLTHEMIHALRAMDTRRKGMLERYTYIGADKDLEEAATHSETTARMRKDELPFVKNPSYYSRVRDPKYPDSRLEDKKTLTGNKQHVTGEPVFKAMEDNFWNTHLSQMANRWRGHGFTGREELVDQYFKVQDKKTKRVQYVHAYNPSMDMSEKQTAQQVEQLDGVKGDDIVWAYHDGRISKVIR